MKSRTWLFVFTGIIVSALAISAAPGSAQADDACGSKENPCPLQKWMKANMGPAMAASDMPALEKALTKAGSFSPDPSWEWASIAKAGAEAAKKGDTAGVKASCKSCHDKYKDQYKSKFRTKPVS
jgi:hypothetical protein